jgi:hypothetical protein
MHSLLNGNFEDFQNKFNNICMGIYLCTLLYSSIM